MKVYNEKELTLKNGSNIRYQVGTAFCYLKFFEINGIMAKEEDFGKSEDISPETAEPYGCGYMKFLPKECDQKVIEKYGITEEEYDQICEELDCLSFGCCGYCI